MDFRDEIKQFGDRVEKLKNQIHTEEATKNAFIMPFIKAEGTLQISLDNEPGGFYLVRVFTAEGGLIKTHKLALVKP